MGDVHWAEALERFGSDADHLPSDSAQKEASVSIRNTTTTSGLLLRVKWLVSCRCLCGCMRVTCEGDSCICACGALIINSYVF